MVVMKLLVGRRPVPFFLSNFSTIILLIHSSNTLFTVDQAHVTLG